MYPKHYFDTYWRNDLRNEVFVAMPFHAEFEPVWKEAIQPSIENDQEISLIANRVDVSVLSGSIVTDIFDGIAHSRLILADLSVVKEGKWQGQRNGNVMYEIGLSHALRQPEEIILIRCDDEEINFDLAGIRVNRYASDDLQSTRVMIAKLIKDAFQTIDRSKSLQVQRAIESLDVDCLEYLHRFADVEGFKEAQPTKMEEVLVSISQKAALIKLQSMGITKCTPFSGEPISMYEWTEFGKSVLKKLGNRI